MQKPDAGEHPVFRCSIGGAAGDADRLRSPTAAYVSGGGDHPELHPSGRPARDSVSRRSPSRFAASRRPAGGQLVLRDTRAVALTDNGEAMAGFARTILAAQDEAVSYFTGSAMRGRLRFGAADELALSELPTILRDFRQLNPRINLELTVTQSGILHRRLAANSLDLIFVNQEADSGRGRLVRRDRLVWVGIDRIQLDELQPVPLITITRPASAAPPPSTRWDRRTAAGESPATPVRSTGCWRPPGPESASACWPREPGAARPPGAVRPVRSAAVGRRGDGAHREPAFGGRTGRGAQQVDLEPAPGATAPLTGRGETRRPRGLDQRALTVFDVFEIGPFPRRVLGIHPHDILGVLLQSGDLLTPHAR